MKNLFITLALSLVSACGFAQLTVNNGFTAQQLSNNLAGSNITVTNPTVSGAANQSGTFQYIGTDLGLNSGVILSTGNIFDAVGPNNSGITSTDLGGGGDPGLSVLSGTTTHDAVVLQFDFEVQSDEIEFDFVFMSEEYNEFINTGFNDVFAFYISGPGITGQENLAVVPSTTTPITINSINTGSFWQYYVDNAAGGINIEFDGFTTLMKAKKTGLTQCGTYTLSLRIADGGDGTVDAAVLLKENSLVQSNISATSSTFSTNNTALEGCVNANFTFKLDTIAASNVDITIGIGGTATNGVDYTHIDSVITIPAGQLSATIIINALADGLVEGQEVIELYFKSSPCAAADTVLLYINDYTPIEYNITPSNVSCFGAANGQVDLTVTGGIPPYTLTLTDSATGNVTTHTSFPVTGLDIGTYYVKVIDGYGCTADDLTVGSLFNAGQTFLPDGTGASYTSSLTISGFPAAQTMSNANQVVSICATMEHSYANDLTIVLEAPNGAQVQLKNVGPTGGSINSCNLGEPVASGPVDNWNASNITPGVGYNYCWTATPTYATMGNIIQAAAPGPPPQYTYTTLAGNSYTDYYLPAGSYTPVQNFNGFIGTTLNGQWDLIITDNYAQDNGYIFDWSVSLQADIPDSVFTITQPGQPTISSTVVAPNCGATNGSIDLTVSSGNPPFTFLWNTGATTEDISGIAAGTYTVGITDDSSCVHTYQVNLSNNGALTLAGVITNETCAGNNDGAIDLTVSGANLPITYSWSSGGAIEDISNLTPGTHTVTVQDATGCQGTESYVVGAATTINMSSAITNEKCGDGEGIINLTINGGVTPYTFLWSNGEVTQMVDDLSQGQYSVTITDANGCTVLDTFTVINLVGNCIPNCDLVINNSSVVNETCGNASGAIDLTVFTSNGPLQVNWGNGATTEDLSSLTAGNYVVTLSDNAGCNLTQSYTIINQTGGLTITGINVTNEYCGNTQGGLDATISGGAQPYTFSWSNGATTEDLTGVSAGTYILTVTDANSCSYSDTGVVSNDAGTLNQTYGNAVDEVCGQSNGSIDIVISGGAQPYTFSWSNGATTEDLVSISAGSYTCTITDAGGCSITTPTYVVNNNAGSLAFIKIDVDNEVCSNGLGEIELFFSGGTAPYTFVWNTGSTTQNLYTLSAGTYSATITDASGCQLTTGNLSLVNESGTLNLDNLLVLDETCGNGTGMVNITVSGGTSPITYLWSNGSTSEDISNLSAGNYSVVVTDSNGCKINTNATVNNNPGILAVDNIIITNENCGQSDGALNLIISGETAPVNYTWSSGQTTQDLSSISAGSYIVNITDANGCTVAGNATVINNSGTLSLTNSQIVNEICSGTNASIDITVSGGAIPYSFLWSNGATTEDISGIGAGSYSCVVTDNLGCIINAGPYTINNGTGGFQASLDSLTNEVCTNTLGAIDITITGGSSPYAISWSSGQTTEDLAGLSAGTYIVTITDAGGCTLSESYTVNNLPGTLSLDSTLVTDENCSNGGGAINIVVAGGTTPYSFVWSNASTTEDLTGLSQGNYTVTISDNAGCSLTSSNITVNNNSGSFSLDGLTVSNETCGDGSGNIDITVSGGTVPVSYSWSNGATTEDLTNLNSGSYSGTATDASGCVLSFSGTVTNTPGSMVVTDSIVAVTCAQTDGSLFLTVMGATLPISYVWSNGATTEDIQNLTAGNYTCNITDSVGCTYNYTGTVGSNPTLLTTATSNDEICGHSDGSISVTVSGGNAPYTYSWTGSSATTSSLTNIPAGTYTCTITDSIGCTVSNTITINNNNPFTVSNTITTDSCGLANGAIDLTLVGGSSYTFAWSNGATTEDISNLSGGTYTVNIADAGGCSITDTLVVGNTATYSASGVVSADSCGIGVGAIDLTLSGGLAPFTFIWSNATSTEDISGLSAGSYHVSITDANGCVVKDTFAVNSTATFTHAGTLTNDTCSSGVGAVDLTLSGGSTPFTFVWSNGPTTEDLSGLSIGTYSVTITDASGCSATDSFAVNNISTFTSNGIVSADSCGLNNGTIDLTLTGGSTPFTFVWSNGASTEDISGLSSGTYSVTITDATGCSDNASFFVNNSSSFTIAETIINDTCNQGNGSIDLTLTSTNPCCTYTLTMQSLSGFGGWNGASVDVNVNGSLNGNYTLPSTSNNITHNISICDGDLIELVYNSGAFDFENAYTLIDAGGTTIFTSNNPPTAGSVYSANASCPSANPVVTYSWSNGATTEDIANLTAGTYTVTVAQTGGCTVTDTFVVNNITTFTTFGTVTADSCNIGAGAIDVTALGGTVPYTFVWSNGATTEDIAGLSPGTYSVTITDASGCVDLITYTVGNTTNFTSSSTLTDATCGNCNDGVIDLTVTGDAPFTFAWSNGATTEDATNLLPSSYFVIITGNSGCVDSLYFIVSHPVGVEYETINTNWVLNVYPNPTKGNFTLSYQFNSTSEVTFLVFNILGEIVHKDIITNNEGELNVDVRNMNPGIYFLKLINENKQQTLKLIIAR